MTGMEEGEEKFTEGIFNKTEEKFSNLKKGPQAEAAGNGHPHTHISDYLIEIYFLF